MATTQISIRLTTELLGALQAAAAAEDRELRDWIRGVLAKKVGQAPPEMLQGFQVPAIKAKALKTQKKRRRERD